jgi:hypothetical protein
LTVLLLDGFSPLNLSLISPIGKTFVVSSTIVSIVIKIIAYSPTLPC